MTNREILDTALRQSAIDCNCHPSDFLLDAHVLTRSKKQDGARVYLPLPFACDLVSYGNNIVAQTNDELAEVVEQYIQSYPVEHCFQVPNLHVLDKMLEPYGYKVCFMAEYFLPDISKLKPLSCPYETRVLYKKDFTDLYKPEWSNALLEKRKELDVLAVGAYDNGKLVGLAGCSADCKDMYQIGIDVLPEYRRRGIASALTSRLALEVLALGKVPFYCAAWSNIRSVRNAIRSGFRPAWVELTAREISYVEEINSQQVCKQDDTELSERVKEIRESEKQSHLQMYNEHELFASDGWLAKPVRSVMDLLSYFENNQSMRVLDLGCGVGRNSIPIAKRFFGIPCRVDCVDFLPPAIEKLEQYASLYGVGHAVYGINCSIEDFSIERNTYDLIIAVSALEHICTYQIFCKKLREIRDGILDGGIACLIIGTDIEETDLEDGTSLQPRYELTLSSSHLTALLHRVFFGFYILKEHIEKQQYNIPRGEKKVRLTTNVVTYIIKKAEEKI